MSFLSRIIPGFKKSAPTLFLKVGYGWETSSDVQNAEGIGLFVGTSIYDLDSIMFDGPITIIIQEKFDRVTTSISFEKSPTPREVFSAIQKTAGGKTYRFLGFQKQSSSQYLVDQLELVLGGIYWSFGEDFSETREFEDPDDAVDFGRVCFHTPTIIVFKDQSFTSDKELTESLTICRNLFTKATSDDDDAFECFFDKQVQ